MKKVSLLIVIGVLIVTSVFSMLPASASSAQPDTWVMVDGLGRTLSDNGDVGDTDNSKSVGMFYWPWHADFAKKNQGINLVDILSKYPEAINNFNHSAWGGSPAGTYYFWDRPVYGFYSSTDVYVIRRQAELLADAGVDVIFMDCSNGTFLWKEAVEVIFRVFRQATKDGINVPKIAFLLNFAGGDDTKAQLQQLYSSIYIQNRYSDLWFYWDGKPLIMANPKCLTSDESAIKNFFTFRIPEPGYKQGNTTVAQNRWGWLNTYPQALHCVDSNGNVEQMTVSVAQNWNHEGLVAMNDPSGGVQGRSYTEGAYSYTYKIDGKTITVNKNIANSYYYGLNFQQQWDYAISKDPEFIFVTGWNEWVAGRQVEWQGTENAFPDQFSPEYSRDIEPSSGVLKDYYYTQLVENIRRFKGVSKQPTADSDAIIDIYSGTDQWADILPEYTHYTNSNSQRYITGYNNKLYRNSSFRNDITSAKVAYDDTYVYFMVETLKDLSPYTDNKWMRLFIDTDADSTENSWEGFEYVLNRVSPSAETATLEKSTGGWNFTKVGQVEYTVHGNRLQVQIPRSMLGLGSGKNIPSFSFKWADNNVTDGDIMELYTDGDCAPGSRYAFLFDASDVSYNPQVVDVPYSISLTGNNTKLSIYKGKLFGLSEKKTSSVVASEFNNSSNIVTDAKSFVGTGTKISLVIDGETKDYVTAIVLGDVNGDGIVTTADYLKVKKYMNNPTLLTGYFFTAADINQDGKIMTIDYTKIKRHFSGSFNLYN